MMARNSIRFFAYAPLLGLALGTSSKSWAQTTNQIAAGSVLNGPALIGQPSVTFSKTLSEAESTAEKNSGNLKASEASWLAAKSEAQAARSPLFPTLNLNGNYYYQTHIPHANFGGQDLPLQFHNNYTIGPELSYTLFDAGVVSNQARSAKTAAQARGEDYKSSRRQITYSVKKAYAAVQLALKNLNFTAASLKLSQAQSHDVDLRFRAGSVSRLDQVSAHKETLTYQLKFQSAQTELGAALKDLFALIGETQNYDTSRAFSAELAKNPPGNIEPATMVVQTESIESVINSFHLPESASSASNGAQKAPMDLPQLRALALSAEAARQSADSAAAAYWPKISLSAKSEILYPDFFLDRQAENNIFAVNLSLPIFNAGQTQNTIEQRRSEARAAEYQRTQMVLDLNRDYNKAKDALITLRTQAKLDEQNVKESSEIADLTYRSYRAGTKNFLDVQEVNVQLLEAEVQSTRTQQQILNQLAALEALSSNSKQ